MAFGAFRVGAAPTGWSPQSIRPLRDAENAIAYWAQLTTNRLSSWTSGTTPS
jgi:hypothetical protein